MVYVDVILPLGISGTYFYRVPDSITCPSEGMRVLVPVGNRPYVGIVYHSAVDLPSSLDPLKVKSLIAVLDSAPAVNKQQMALWEWLATYYMCPIGDVMAAALPKMVVNRSYDFSPYKKRRIRKPKYIGEISALHPLDAQQERAVQEIHSTWQSHLVTLLHGVTSSGKTEVYIHLIEEQLQQGMQVLYLVPEIALTTQLTERLQAVFGSRLEVYHSRISDVQRAEIYRTNMLPDTDGRLIVGARSAVFLPFHRLGLVIVDEEHEVNYKQQDPAPRYHARAVAIILAQLFQAKILLGSATPSMESYYNAMTGKYGLVTMQRRYQGLQLPKITLIDLRRQYHRKEMYGHFSDPLVARMKEELGRGKQIILFQNRRGYAPQLVCASCGQTPKCVNCAVPMTLHRRIIRSLTGATLVCHYCGYTTEMPRACPSCGGEMKPQGFGTERLEDEVSALFPQARVLRMDFDSTRSKADYQHIIDAFSRHEVDILIGTQMVAKGLHFDDVSLVAVLNADNQFNLPDFRAYERAFQMLEQVSGRAGRKGNQGEVIIQTFDTEHPIFSYLQDHSYETFYIREIAERKRYGYPPFYRIITLSVRHTREEKVHHAATILQLRLRQAFGSRCSEVIEPNVVKIKRTYCKQIRLKIEVSASYSKAKAIVKRQIEETLRQDACRSVSIVADVDPI